MTNGIVTIRTDRLTLRPQVLDDFPAYRAFLVSPRSVGMGGPFDTRAAWGMFCHDLSCWHFFGHGALMIETAGTKQCVGQVGINHGPLFPEKELGWLLYDGYGGHGYATEAARALRDWAFATLKLPTLVSYMSPDNAMSAAVAKRLGGILDLSAPREDPEDIVYRYQNQLPG
jgi:RimJ/RimL family protein N-acetyltransferase